MDVVTCQHCGAQVLSMAGNECPHCGQAMAASDATAELHASDGPPMALEPREAMFPDVKPNASQNPYQAPAAGVDPWVKDFAYDASADQGVIWSLFRFRGRIPRRAYWGWSIAATLAYYGGIAAIVAVEAQTRSIVATESLAVILMGLFFWVTLAVQAKRWHDRGRSGFWFLINLIPLIGPLIAFVELGCLRGTYGPNQYGPDPT